MMDNFNCLKVLTEDIVKQQNDSIESLNKLRLKTDAVSADVSNLINSLQMVGNKQFVENRVSGDDISDGPLHRERSTDGADNTRSERLSLSSILLKAIELVPHEIESFPARFHSEEKLGTQIQPSDSDNPRSDRPEAFDGILPTLPHQQHDTRDYVGPSQDALEISRAVEVKTSSEAEPKVEQSPVDNASKSTRLANRDRITDILKRYSLYDDDDDDYDDDDGDED